MTESENIAIGILDLFERLLEQYDITVPDEDRTGEETEARLYGDTYYSLQKDIADILDKSLGIEATAADDVIVLKSADMELKTSQCEVATRFANTFLDYMYYERDASADSLYVFKADMQVGEAFLSCQDDKKGIVVNGKWYCLPDAEDVFSNFLCTLFERRKGV